MKLVDYKLPQIAIIADCILQTRKQSRVRQIVKICKEHACLSAVNKHSQNFVGNNRNKIKIRPKPCYATVDPWSQMRQLKKKCPEVGNSLPNITVPH